MDMHVALRARLLGATAAGQRVYWVTRPQSSALPAITLQTVSGGYPQTYDGLQATRSPRIQLDAWAASHSEARAIIAAAVAELAPKETSNGVVFDSIQFDGERDFVERVGTTDIYRTSVDLIVWHHPA
jgi:hypothetical protein